MQSSPRTVPLVPIILGVAIAVLMWQFARAQNYDIRVVTLLALTNSAVSIKASPGQLVWYSCYNPNSTTTYVQFYDSVAVVVVGTTAPTRVFPLPPTQATGFLTPNPVGSTSAPSGAYPAAAGMQAAATTTATGATAPTTAVNCDMATR